MNYINKLLILFVILMTLNLSCSNNKTLKIAISKASGSASYANYPNWLKKVNPEIEIIDFHNISQDSALKILLECDGLLLSGGPDVHPGRFGKAEDTSACSIDLVRDSVEFKAIEIALKNKIPILGICRGEQILNVHLGGSLIIDIPSNSNIIKQSSKILHQNKEISGDTRHKVRITESSLLYRISNTILADVNSNHHQAIDKVASDLYVSSRTEDGLVESIEWSNPAGKSWLLAVQWHPERLENDSKLSIPIAKEFLKQAEIFKNGRK